MGLVNTIVFIPQILIEYHMFCMAEKCHFIYLGHALRKEL